MFSKTRISKYLSSCVFNPKTPGPMSIIADVGNREYYVTRAIEMLKSGDKAILIKEAIKLLVLAGMSYEDTQNGTPTNQGTGPGRTDP